MPFANAVIWIRFTECNREPYFDIDSTLQDPDRGDEGRTLISAQQ